MERYDYLIIGGGVAGVTAAETIRECDASATIGVISDEPHMFYSRVLLPAYAKARIPREKVFLRTVDDFDAKKIDYRSEETVVCIDVAVGEVELANRVRIGYGKLLIASGGHVKLWGDPADQDAVYRLQTLADADRIVQNLPKIKAPLIIGSSFISLEFIEIFLSHHITPTVLVRGPQFFDGVIDAIGWEALRENFDAKGVHIYTNQSVMDLARHGSLYEVHTQGHDAIRCDAFAVGIGLDRNIDFLSGSGIAVGKQGVKVNEFLETGSTGVWAAGDSAEFYDTIFGRHRVVGNWTHAFLQGKRAGLNMAGQREPFRGVSGYSITNLGVQITMLGDTSGAEDTVVRVGRKDGQIQYERFFLHDGLLMGAVLLNRFSDKPYLARLIAARAPVEKYREGFQDISFDIGQIPVVGS